MNNFDFFTDIAERIIKMEQRIEFLEDTLLNEQQRSAINTQIEGIPWQKWWNLAEEMYEKGKVE